MARFAATTNAFEKGVDSIKPEAAVKLIEEWSTQLEELDSKGGKQIVKDLEALKKEFGKGDKMDGEKVKALTAKLGQETVKIADEDEKSGDKVRALGEALTKAAG